MTIPSEEKIALNKTWDFLRSLLYPKETPRVSSRIRNEAYHCLKHYPMPYRIAKLYKKEVKKWEKEVEGGSP